MRLASNRSMSLSSNGSRFCAGDLAPYKGDTRQHSAENKQLTLVAPQAAICIVFKRFAYCRCEDTPLSTPRFWQMKSNLLEPLRPVCYFGKRFELCRVRRFLIREPTRDFCCDRTGILWIGLCIGNETKQQSHQATTCLLPREAKARAAGSAA
jgi:hypothetical protein